MKRYPFLLLFVLFLAACSEDRARQPFAQVNGTDVTYGQLDLAKARFGLDDSALAGQAESEKRIKEMLVSSRAMALLAEKGLSDDEESELETRVAMYREELLVKKYLQANAKPEPVSGEAVKAYYEKHPEEFGGGKERSFEILSTVRQPTGKDRETILRQFGAASQSRDWAGIARSLSSLGVAYKRGRSRPELLESPLRQLVSATPVGKTSDLHMGSDGIVLVRVTDEKTLPPKGLMEVSAEIRKKLAPNKLKDAIKVVSAEALKQVTVEYEE